MAGEALQVLEGLPCPRVSQIKELSGDWLVYLQSGGVCVESGHLTEKGLLGSQGQEAFDSPQLGCCRLVWQLVTAFIRAERVAAQSRWELLPGPRVCALSVTPT